jgi:hypothetical protein
VTSLDTGLSPYSQGICFRRDRKYFVDSEKHIHVCLFTFNELFFSLPSHLLHTFTYITYLSFGMYQKKYKIQDAKIYEMFKYDTILSVHTQHFFATSPTMHRPLFHTSNVCLKTATCFNYTQSSSGKVLLQLQSFS